MDEQRIPRVFISFNYKSKEFVDSLEKKLSKVATVCRYEEKVPTWGSFTDFMNTIKDHDFAVLVVSEAYLESYACMYEVLQAMKNDNWKDKIIIVLMPDTKPYLDDERIKYIRYWEEQYKDICEKLEGVSELDTNSLMEKKNRIGKIKSSIDHFLGFIADSKCPPIWDAIQEICDRVSLSKRSIFTYTTSEGEVVNMRLVCILDFIRNNSNASVSEIATAIGINEKSVRYYITNLLERKLIEMQGNKRYCYVGEALGNNSKKETI